MVRFLGSFLGGIFTLLTMGALAGALLVGAVLWFFAQDLPSHDKLATYAPATISRVYSQEGNIIDDCPLPPWKFSKNITTKPYKKYSE